MEYSEQTTKPQTEMERKEYAIPPEIARPFGVWLKEKLSGLTSGTEQALNSPDTAEETDTERVSLINEMRQALTKTNLLLEKLCFSKETKLMPALGGQWTLHLSPFSEDEKPREIKSVKSTIAAPYAKPFITALSDLMLNPISYLKGYSELIENRSSVIKVKEQMKKIKELSVERENILDPFQEAGEIRIEVDENGKVDIIPVLKPAETPLPTLENP